VQAAPVYEQQNRGQDGERISGGSVIEDSRDPFQSGQRDVAPDFNKNRPFPTPRRRDLTEVQLTQTMQGSKSDELENRIGKTEQGKSEPDAFETQDAAQTVAQGETNWIEKQDDEIAAAKSEQRINSRDGIQHRRRPQGPGKWSVGVME
jgi:hypothetical protein